MADGGGFTMGGGGNVMGGTVWIGVAVKDFDKFKAAMQQVKGESEKTAKAATTGMNEFKSSLMGLVPAMSAAAIASKELQTIWSSFKGWADQETAINRVVLAAERLGQNTKGLSEQMDKLGTMAIRAGQQESTAFEVYQKLLQVTKDRTEAEYLFSKALAFSIAQKRDLSAVGVALAAAYDHQTRQLIPLLRGVETGVKDMDNFADVMKAVEEAGKGANRVFSDGTTALQNFDAAWDNFKDTLGRKVSPALTTVIDKVTRLVDIMAENPWLAMLPGATGWIYAYGKAILGRRGGQAGAGEEWSPQTVTDWQKKWGEIPVGTDEGAGKGVPYGKTQRYAQELARRMSEDQYIDRMRAGRKSAAEEWDKTLEAFRKYQAALKDWNIEQSPAYQGALQMASLFSDTLVDAITGVKLSFEDLGRSMLRILAQIIARLLEMKLTGFINTAFGHSDTSGKPTAPVVTGEGYGGVRPMPGGAGVNIVLQGTSNGVLAAIYRGATLVERRHVSRDIYLVGGSTAAAGA